MRSRVLVALLLGAVLGFGAAGHLVGVVPRVAYAQANPDSNPLAQTWNTASVSSAVFSSTFAPLRANSAMRITICVQTSGVLYLRETSGATSLDMALNGGTALTANAIYTFVLSSRVYSTGTTPIAYSLRLASGGTVSIARVEEISGGVL